MAERPRALLARRERQFIASLSDSVQEKSTSRQRRAWAPPPLFSAVSGSMTVVKTTSKMEMEMEMEMKI
jgi:hypothetical protein